MALIDIHLIQGVFDDAQKTRMIEGVTDTMVRQGGPAMRGVTWVRVHELADGDWSIGGRPLTAADMKSLTDGDKRDV